MSGRMELVVTVALEAMDRGKRKGRVEATRREDVTDKMAVFRREPLVRHVLQQLAGVTATDAATHIIDRLVDEVKP